jgi:uncharacterized protein (TIGR02594 family)
MYNEDFLKKALSQVGVREWKGGKHNPEVLKYFHDIGFDAAWITDETAWCSAFINWCALVTGYEASYKLNARSWLNEGHEVVDPQIGDLVIYWRESPQSWKGHVGIFISHMGNHIYTLGGNQSNMVNIAPYNDERLLGFRRLRKIYGEKVKG